MDSPHFAQLSNCTAVVTGASSGIGRAIAREFAAAGAAGLVVHFRTSREPAERLAAEIRESSGCEAVALQADLSQAAALGEFADACQQHLGAVDVWVNNAGVDLLTGDNRNLPPEDKLQHLLDVDVRSSVLLSRLVGRRMKERGRGVILNIGWDQADRGMEGDSGELFAASKNAVMGFTRSLAVSLAPEVRVNCIAPGWIRTAWGETAPDYWQSRVLQETPLKRWGTPEDIARMARFLASDAADFITGQIINVNGGAVR